MKTNRMTRSQAARKLAGLAVLFNSRPLAVDDYRTARAADHFLKFALHSGEPALLVAAQEIKAATSELLGEARGFEVNEEIVSRGLLALNETMAGDTREFYFQHRPPQIGKTH